MDNLIHISKNDVTNCVEFDLVYVNKSKYKGDWNSIPHTHHFTELFCIVSGTGNFFIEKETYKVQTDDLVIVNPNVLHTEMSFNASPLEYIVIGVSGLSFSFFDEDSINTHSIQDCKSNREDILFYLNSLVAEYTLEKEHSKIMCQNLLENLLIIINRNPHFSSKTVYPQKTDRKCNIAKRYIDANFKENISLDELADVTHTSKFYLTRSFTSYFGVSPMRYQLIKRIEESKKLLLTTDHSITQIAQILGFSSSSYFSQAFLKEVGEPPSQYREKSSMVK